jgi:hypothetical protein
MSENGPTPRGAWHDGAGVFALEYAVPADRVAAFVDALQGGVPLPAAYDWLKPWSVAAIEPDLAAGRIMVKMRPPVNGEGPPVTKETPEPERWMIQGAAYLAHPRENGFDVRKLSSGAEYQLSRGANGWQCTCPGFTGHQHCKHARYAEMVHPARGDPTANGQPPAPDPLSAATVTEPAATLYSKTPPGPASMPGVNPTPAAPPPQAHDIPAFARSVAPPQTPYRPGLTPTEEEAVRVLNQGAMAAADFAEQLWPRTSQGQTYLRNASAMPAIDPRPKMRADALRVLERLAAVGLAAHQGQHWQLTAPGRERAAELGA